MDKLKMHSADIADEKFRKLAALFPEAVTETVDSDGNVVRAIDKDVLTEEINRTVVDGLQERYQFTWPDKRKARNLANTPTTKTLRLIKEKSVGRDGKIGGVDSENIYIEGDNLDALKILRETYLGKVKMIYIDPPYNTGNDFVYFDDFTQSANQYINESGQYDDIGNQLVQNPETIGRFHSNWLNMIYPRLKLAKDFLSDDGAIFISIDDHEQENLCKICNEIFGEKNFIACVPWRKRTAKSDVPFGVSQDYEFILAYAKSNAFVASTKGKERKYYVTPDYPGKPWRFHDLTKQTTAAERPNSNFTILNPKNGKKYPANPRRTWAISEDTFKKYYEEGRIIFPGDYDFLDIKKPVLRYWKDADILKAGSNFGRIAVSTKLPDDIGMSQDGTREITKLMGNKVFGFPKPSQLIKFLISILGPESSSAVIMDFFSGSATTAQAVMESNSIDGGNRKFILVQLPEVVQDGTDASAAGFKYICDIGEKRIQAAGAKIKTDSNASMDYGFRCFKIDSSNMRNVFYRPSNYNQEMMDLFADNIKGDRTSEDLLIQVMLDLGILLSSKIEKIVISGKEVFSVANGYLLACFDKDITDEVVRNIAEKHPYYAVFRDYSMATDSVAVNFDQIFNTYSPKTIRKVL